jgi:hypothetical protein
MHFVEIFNLIFGLLIIGSGFLVKAFPDTIAGYSTMSKEEKKNVDIKRASTFIRNGYIITGLTIIAGYYILKWIGLGVFANYFCIAATLTGTAIIIIMAQKFDHNKYKKT